VYTAGKIIHFNPFFFENGNSKNKYFLVIKVIDGNAILASLPSSQDHLPTNTDIKHGCIELPDARITTYVFEANKPVTHSGWGFKQNTFLHGCWLDDYEISSLNKKYAIEKVDYNIIGELTTSELKSIIECFSNSVTVKRKYKKLLK
jgi:hypothetical protein